MQGCFFFKHKIGICALHLFPAKKKKVGYELREPLGFEDSEAAREHSSSPFAKD